MMLVLESVAKSVGDVHPRRLFRDVRLTLSPGEYVAIMGDSGVGKSTLLNLVAGLIRPDHGRICLAGQDIARLSDDEATRLRRRSMGFVFQAFHVLPHLTVQQNVELPLQLLGCPRRCLAPRARALLQAVGLQGREGDYPSQLSGGEVQRVAIARALVHRPALVLADEPTGNLDRQSGDRVLALLRAHIKSSATGPSMGLLVTHSHRAAATADRVLTLTARGLVEARPAGRPGAPS